MADSLTDLPLERFLALTAARVPGPGGGAVAAVTVAAAAALVGMAARFAAGRPAGSGDLAAQADLLRVQALALTEQDVQAYAAVLAAGVPPAARLGERDDPGGRSDPDERGAPRAGGATGGPAGPGGAAGEPAGTGDAAGERDVPPGPGGAAGGRDAPAGPGDAPGAGEVQGGRAPRARQRAALRLAAQVPTRVAELSAQVAALGLRLVEEGNPNLRPDAVTAILLAEAAGRAAAHLVEVNARQGGLGPELPQRAGAAVRAAALARHRAGALGAP